MEVILKYHKLSHHINWEKTITVLEKCCDASESKNENEAACILLCMLNSEFNGAATRESLVLKNWSDDDFLIHDEIIELTRDNNIILPIVTVPLVDWDMTKDILPDYKFVDLFADVLTGVTITEPLVAPITLSMAIIGVNWMCELEIPAGVDTWLFPVPIVNRWIFPFGLFVKGLPDNADLRGCLMNEQDRHENNE